MVGGALVLTGIVAFVVGQSADSNDEAATVTGETALVADTEVDAPAAPAAVEVETGTVGGSAATAEESAAEQTTATGQTTDPEQTEQTAATEQTTVPEQTTTTTLDPTTTTEAPTTTVAAAVTTAGGQEAVVAARCVFGLSVLPVEAVLDQYAAPYLTADSTPGCARLKIRTTGLAAGDTWDTLPMGQCIAPMDNDTDGFALQMVTSAGDSYRISPGPAVGDEVALNGRKLVDFSAASPATTFEVLIFEGSTTDPGNNWIGSCLSLTPSETDDVSRIAVNWLG